MRRDRKRQLIGVAATVALAATPIIGDEILAASLMGGVHTMSDTTSGQRERRRTGEAGAHGATPKYVGALIIGMIVFLGIQVGALKGFVQH